jgi:predicted ferric reductase
LVGIAGLFILVAWAILPRWRAMIPAAAHRLVLAIRAAPGVRYLRKLVGGYERWRSVHRATGLFVAAGIGHALLDGTPFQHAPLLRWSFVAIGGIGLAFYGYREVLARHFVPLADYQVDSVSAVGAGIVEIALAPLGRPVAFAPGQFAMLFLEGQDGWHRHPFTIASAPREDFYTSASADLPYAAEIREIADRYELMHVHFVDSSRAGHLTAERVMVTADGSPGTLSVFMCGPAAMVRDFQADFRRAGVSGRHIHREYFDLHRGLDSTEVSTAPRSRQHRGLDSTEDRVSSLTPP